MSKKNIKEKTNLNFEVFKNFLRLKKSLFIVYFVILFYIGAFILCFLKVAKLNIVVNNMFIFSVLVLLISLLGAVGMMVRDLLKYQQVTNSLCFKVIEKSQEREQYKRFLEIKKCIENYKNTEDSEENCDTETNVAVIEAAIEYDQAQSVLVPLFITVLTVILFEAGKISVFSYVGSFFAILMVLVVAEQLRQIPRNAFIKKVVEKIKEDEKEKRKKNKKDK